MKKNNIVFFFAASLTVSTSVAQISSQELSGKSINTITTAVPFLLIAPDSRAGGMGDAGVSTSPDANSIHWNPAKLGMVDKKFGLSMSYSPWLKKLVNDIHLLYLSGYYKLGKGRVMGASLRYFSLGNITFTDINAQVIREFNPNEFAIDAAISQKLTDNFSVGMAARYIYSNLTGGTIVAGSATHAGQSFAVDISAFYSKKDVKLGDKKAVFSAGLNISNIGSKMSYSDAGAVKDFIPINLRLGPTLEVALDEYNSIAFTIDVNKLLVPTPPIYARDSTGNVKYQNGKYVIEKGKDPDRGIVSGMMGSFNDAPGGFKEEMREFTYSAGIEYWYDKQFAVRAGYFYEDVTKGNRKYFTAGIGLKYNIFGLDMAYLIPTQQQNPLEHTLRFTMLFDFNSGKGADKPDTSTN
jgi:hypothetical protein